MSSTHASASTTSSTLPTGDSPSSNARLVNSLEASLVIVIILLVIVSVLFALHLRRSRSLTSCNKSRQGFAKTNSCRKPFGGELPRYKHIAGSNMRIATRGWDGAWHFADSTAPFSPFGVSDPSPSPSSSTLTFPSQITALSDSEAKAKAKTFDMIPSLEYLPPADYGYNVGYGDHKMC